MADRRTYFNTASGVTGEYPSALAEISPNLVEVVEAELPEPEGDVEQPPIDPPANPAPTAPTRTRAKASTNQEED